MQKVNKVEQHVEILGFKICKYIFLDRVWWEMQDLFCIFFSLNLHF